ncbi:MAG: hypothetical protein HC859_12900, partial [Bacteroidia bacterium]|nr:hypothetical protein [Bacteroidia bacterium]
NFDNTFAGLVNKITAAGTPGIELLVIGRDGTPHQYEVHAGPSAGSLRLLTTQSFFGYNKQQLQLPLQWSDIGADGSLVVRLRPLGVSGQIDQLSLSYIKVNYTEATSMDGTEKTFELLPNPDGKSYLEITGAPAGAGIFDITDKANVRRIGFSGSTTLQAMIDNGGTPRTLLVTSSRITPSLKK